MNWWQRFKRSSAHTQANIVCTFIVMVATIAYVAVATLQWLEIKRTNTLTQQALNGSGTALTQTLTKMQGQVDAMNKLADKAGIQADKLDASVKQASRLAKDTEEANANALQADRPWMGGYIQVSDFEADKKPTYTIVFTNSGRRPAHIDFSGAREDWYPAFPADPDREYWARVTDEQPSTNVVVPGQQVIMVSQGTTPLTPVDLTWASTLDSTHVFFVFADVNYTDLRTNEKHWTHICERYYPKMKTDKDAGFRNCKEYNDAR